MVKSIISYESKGDAHMLIKCPVCNKKQWGYNDSRSYIVCQICGYAASERKIQDNENKKNVKTIQQMVKELEKISFFNKFGLRQTPEVVDYVKEYFQCSGNVANSVLKTYREQYYNIYEHDYITKAEPKAATILNQPKCPKCGCTNIQVVRRKFSLLTGFATNKTDRVCANCNYKW